MLYLIKDQTNESKLPTDQSTNPYTCILKILNAIFFVVDFLFIKEKDLQKF